MAAGNFDISRAQGEAQGGARAIGNGPASGHQHVEGQQSQEH